MLAHLVAGDVRQAGVQMYTRCIEGDAPARIVSS